jgi:AbiU2
VAARKIDIDKALKLKHVPAPRNSKCDKWERWFDQIDNDICDLLTNQIMFNQFVEVVRANNELATSPFIEMIWNCYAQTALIGIRRQAEIDSRVVSLGTLLSEITQNSQLLSRERWVARYDKGSQFVGHDLFEQHADATGRHIDPSIVSSDLKKLTSGSKKVKRYVDEYIAHRDHTAENRLIKFEELDEALDLLGELLVRYDLLLMGRGRVEPVSINYDWESVFRIPWVTPP